MGFVRFGLWPSFEISIFDMGIDLKKVSSTNFICVLINCVKSLVYIA